MNSVTSVTPDCPRAFAVWFKDLHRWDPASFQRIVWHWPQDVMRRIGSVLLCFLPHPPTDHAEQGRPRLRGVVPQLGVGASASRCHQPTDHAEQYQLNGDFWTPAPSTFGHGSAGHHAAGGGRPQCHRKGATEDHAAGRHGGAGDRRDDPRSSTHPDCCSARKAVVMTEVGDGLVGGGDRR